MKLKLVKDEDEARDMYLPAEAAKELGIVDFIGMPHIKPFTQYAIEIAPQREYEPVKRKRRIKKKIHKKKVTKMKTAKKKASKRGKKTK